MDNIFRVGQLDFAQIVYKLKSDQRVPLLLSGLVILLTIFVFIGNITLLTGLNTPQLSLSTSTLKPSATANIADWHLFGKYQANMSNLPSTQLQLTLQGTDVTTDSTVPSTAIIADSTNQAKVYKIGDTVPGGATITKIDRKSVV